jgi:molybdopterin-guanine dinucleotide biosynthesis protein A
MGSAPIHELSGVVLAGGRSTRMGREKATLRIDGERLVDRAVRILRTCCHEVLVASGDGARLGGLEVPQVADAVPDAGPLGGLVAGLEAAAHDLVAVVAVDMPNADPVVLRGLARRWSGQAAVIPRSGGRLQPLHAVWSRSAAHDLRVLLSRGERSVTAVAELLGALVVDADGWGPFARNVNRPEDLAEQT